MTMADKIRAMDDQELAEYLNSHSNCDFCMYGKDPEECLNTKCSCVDGILLFLQQEVRK